LLGAGGWFGRTTLELLRQRHIDWSVLAITHRPRPVQIDDEQLQLHGWEEHLVDNFQPTLVLNCAFLTRDRLSDLGVDEYAARNTAATARFLAASSAESVVGSLTVSSGAAWTVDGAAPALHDNPYGHLKRREEQLARDLSDSTGRALVVTRAWSVSGPYVGRPRAYAFSDLVLQAAQGRVHVRAPHPVWRRYVSVHDLMSVSLSRLVDGWSGTIDSGGPLVELGDLARRVVAVTNPSTDVVVADQDGSPADRYHSDNTSWLEACGATGYEPMDLDDQIRAVAGRLRNMVV
jgi:nucleoside-diphosphate-sugar epimerase